MSVFFHTMCSDLKRSFISWRFVISVLCLILIKAPGMWSDLLQYKGADVLYFFHYAPTQGIAVTCYIFSALPCASLFLNDWNHGFFNCIVSRTGKQNYVISKAITCIITPMISIFFSELLFVLLTSLLCPLIDIDSLCQSYNNLSKTQTFGPLLEKSFWYYFGSKTLLAALSGALFSICSIAISTKIPNIFVVVATPFLSRFYLQGIIDLMRLPPLLSIANIESGQYRIGSEIDSLLYGIAFFTILIILGCICFSQGIERRCTNG